ncbi:MAG: helix-turn-helix domain-containing protein [Clostridia bacterium]|nr:helix-turn-helix domain-containing protein [Clostridia bacterium]
MDKTKLDTLGDKIYNLRKKSGMTQGELADKVGVSRQVVSQWENNVICPKSDKLMAICVALNVDLNYFLAEDSNAEQEISCEKSDMAVCDVVEPIEEDIEQPNMTNVIERKKLSIKAKIAISVSVVGILIGIISIVIGHMLTPANEGFVTVTSRDYRFDVECVGWIILSIAIIALAITAIFTIIRNKKRKNQ